MPTRPAEGPDEGPGPRQSRLALRWAWLSRILGFLRVLPSVLAPGAALIWPDPWRLLLPVPLWFA